MSGEAPKHQITKPSIYRRVGRLLLAIMASVAVAGVLAYWLLAPSYVVEAPPHPSFIKHRQNVWSVTCKTRLSYDTGPTYWVWRASAMVSARDEVDSAMRGGWTSAADGIAFLSGWAESRGWQGGVHKHGFDGAEEVFHKEACAATFSKPGNQFLTLYLGVSPVHDEGGNLWAYRLSITTSNASLWTRLGSLLRYSSA